MIIMVNLRQDAFLAACVLQSRSTRGAFVRRCPITVVLLEAKASQCIIPEEILSCVIQEEVRVWILGVALHVKRCARRPRRAFRNKFPRRPYDRASRTNDMKPKEPIVGHAQAESTALQKGSQPSLVLCFKVVPLESAAFLNQLKASIFVYN